MKCAAGHCRLVEGILAVQGRGGCQGTGFQATDFLAPMKITGRAGQELNQVWRDGAEAYLGMTVSGFPNLFLLYGPNTNLGHNSILYMLESQFAYIIDTLQQMRAQQWQSVDVKSQVQGVYNRWVQNQLNNTIWAAGCHSWYKTESGKNTNNWVGFTLLYRYKTRHFQAQDYVTQPILASTSTKLRAVAA